MILCPSWTDGARHPRRFSLRGEAVSDRIFKEHREPRLLYRVAFIRWFLRPSINFPEIVREKLAVRASRLPGAAGRDRKSAEERRLRYFEENFTTEAPRTRSGRNARELGRDRWSCSFIQPFAANHCVRPGGPKSCSRWRKPPEGNVHRIFLSPGEGRPSGKLSASCRPCRGYKGNWRPFSRGLRHLATPPCPSGANTHLPRGDIWIGQFNHALIGRVTLKAIIGREGLQVGRGAAVALFCKYFHHRGTENTEPAECEGAGARSLELSSYLSFFDLVPFSDLA
jgi:hypothetical protein